MLHTPGFRPRRAYARCRFRTFPAPGAASSLAVLSPQTGQNAASASRFAPLFTGVFCHAFPSKSVCNQLCGLASPGTWKSRNKTPLPRGNCAFYGLLILQIICFFPDSVNRGPASFRLVKFFEEIGFKENGRIKCGNSGKNRNEIHFSKGQESWNRRKKNRKLRRFYTFP